MYEKKSTLKSVKRYCKEPPPFPRPDVQVQAQCATECGGGAKEEERLEPWTAANEESERWGSREQQSWQPEPKFNSQCGPLPALNSWANSLIKLQLPQLKNGGNFSALSKVVWSLNEILFTNAWNRQNLASSSYNHYGVRGSAQALKLEGGNFQSEEGNGGWYGRGGCIQGPLSPSSFERKEAHVRSFFPLGARVAW